MSESNSNPILRNLCDLRVIDLKNELEKRILEKTGIKQALIERLKKALIDGGHDPGTFTFEVPSSTIPIKTKKADQPAQDVDVDLNCDDGDAGMNNQITIGFEEDYSDMLQSKSSDDLNSISSTSQATLDVNVRQDGVVKETWQKAGSQGPLLEQPPKQVDLTSQPPSDKLPPSESTHSHTLTTTALDKPPAEVYSIDEAPRGAAGGAQTTQCTAITTQCTAITTQASHTDNNVISIDAQVLNAPLEMPVENKAPVNQEVTNAQPASAEATTAATENNGKNVALKEVPKSVLQSGNQVKKMPVKTVPQGHNLWVSGLSSTTRAADLKNLFSKHGKVTGAKVVTNAKSPGSKCYGFVTMSSHDEAGQCIKNLNRTELHGRIISIERAKADPSVNSALNKKVVAKAKPTEAAKLTVAEANMGATNKGAGDKKVDGGKDDGKKNDDGGKRNDGGKGEGSKGDVGRRDGSRKQPPSRPVREPVRSNYNAARRRMAPPPPLHTRTNRFVNRRRDNNILTLEKIREARERERQREMDRLARQDERRQQMLLMREKERQREVERMQREEACRLAREKEKLRLEKQKLELDRIAAERERVSLEREKQRREREKLEREREERKKELLRNQNYMNERKAAKRPAETAHWMDAKRKVLTSPDYSSRTRVTDRPYGGHVSMSNRSAEKKHVENKARHVIDSRGGQREDLKTRKQEERSRVEWRSVSKNELPSSSSMHQRSSREAMMQPASNYHYQGAWSSTNVRPQVPTSWTNPSVSYPSFATPISYLPPPSSTMPTFNPSRVASSRYEQYKTSRRY